VLGLPGGVSKPVTEEFRQRVREFGPTAVEFARFTLDLFRERVLGEARYRDLLESEAFQQPTHYMGLVDDAGNLSFTGDRVRVVDPDGREIERFRPREYADVLAEHVEEWTYIKFPYLRDVGWNGFTAGKDSGIVRVAPLARLNVADGIPTPGAQAERDRMFEVLGGSPAHHTLAYHWARLIEILHAAEKIVELADADELTSPKVRNMDLMTPAKGVGIVEAPRGTLIHDYETDERGVITSVNLIVATLFNSASISMSIEQAARECIGGGEVDERLLNRVEMAMRAYDPCLSCATSS
jgi:F420-non-reducing hydrogenase large subunit